VGVCKGAKHFVMNIF